MALRTNVQRRPGSAMYYARVSIPVDLQSYYPTKHPGRFKTEIWKSLGTRDPKEAKAKAKPVLAAWDAEFDALRRRRDPSEGDIAKAVWQHYETALAEDQLIRSRFATRSEVDSSTAKLVKDIQTGSIPWSDDPLVQLNASLDLQVMSDAAALDSDRRKILLGELRNHLAKGETALIEWAADDVIHRERLLIPKGSSVYRDLCQRLQRAQIEALERTLERDVGNFAGRPADPIVVPPDPTRAQQIAAPGETILELFEKYELEKKASVTADTWAQNRIIVRWFAEYVGETAHVSAITRKAVRDWKHKLAKWPIKATSVKEFQGMDFNKIVEANETLKRPTIAQNTQNRYLSAIAGFTQWLAHNDYISQDATQGMFLSIDKRKRSRFPFNDDQLKGIFTSPLFRTCKGAENEHLPGNVQIRDWRYWLPWLALYTGARLGELAQLLVADVRELHGVWILHITREGSDLKSTKTEGSQRVVPIHSELIKLGFLEYHRAMANRGEAQLFPEIKPDARGFFSGFPSRWFNKYFRKVRVKGDKTTNFHSFRHTAADAFRRAGFLDEQFAPLLGHTKSTTTGRYGLVPQGILEDRVKMIEAMSYPVILVGNPSDHPAA